MHELPLVFFTVFAQSAVGLMLIAFISNKSNLMSDKQLNKANILSFVLMMIALLIGMFHLGHLFRALNLLYGLGRSSMSNEIVLSGVFVGLQVATLFFTYIKKVPVLKLIANILALFIGLIFIWSITQVYQLDTVVNWNTNYTTLQMWATVLVGGGASALLIGIRLGSAILLAGAIISLLFKPGYMSFINQASNGTMVSEQLGYWGIQSFCLIIGIIIALLTMLKKERIPSIFTIGAVMVMIGELSSRIAFYNLWSISM